jgi:type IV secretory pathway VirD2 relaxase
VNTNTGELYRIREDLMGGSDSSGGGIGEALDRGRLAELERRGKATEDEVRALAAMRAGDAVVPVSETVAQKMMLGGRELNRRERRRKARRS